MAQGSARYERNPDYIFRRIVDEAVLVPIHQDVADMECIYTLNDVGAFVWQQLAAPATEADLQEAILGEYAADSGAVAADLPAFLDDMLAIGAIRRI